VCVLVWGGVRIGFGAAWRSAFMMSEGLDRTAGRGELDETWRLRACVWLTLAVPCGSGSVCSWFGCVEWSSSPLMSTRRGEDASGLVRARCISWHLSLSPTSHWGACIPLRCPIFKYCLVPHSRSSANFIRLCARTRSPEAPHCAHCSALLRFLPIQAIYTSAPRSN
jgi:hypothetical protein